MEFIIRQETFSDYNQVYNLIKSAFQGEENSDHEEQNLVVNLRNSQSFRPELSLVAQLDDQIVGHILFTENKIENHTALTLAPLAILKEYQKQGIGGKLIEKGHEIARELGYKYSVVLGHATYYPKFGYMEASKFGILAPFEIPEENFMAIRLLDDDTDIQGVVQYPKEFGI